MALDRSQDGLAVGVMARLTMVARPVRLNEHGQAMEEWEIVLCTPDVGIPIQAGRQKCWVGWVADPCKPMVWS